MNQSQTSRTETSAKGAGSENSSTSASSGMAERSGSTCRREAEAQGLVDGWNFRLLV